MPSAELELEGQCYENSVVIDITDQTDDSDKLSEDQVSDDKETPEVNKAPIVIN